MSNRPPPSQGYKVSGQGPPDGLTNTSSTLTASMASNNPSTSNTTAQEMGITLGNNFSLGPTAADSKGAYNLIDNPESNHPTLSTAGPGGDQAHDVSLPPNKLHLPPRTNEASRKPQYVAQSGQARDLDNL
ncbi:hypothetical protein OC846_006225 [Tilletia horrida]|uniref:Uncharacterized protein n=1 Tax=Tilletia horrida TaxID=155126 RepID=A0AAN6GJV2_9BASI|nr:hypothetical protein OC846_006225 [Tilletia horrida]